LRILMTGFFAGIVGIAVGAFGYAGISEYSLAHVAITDIDSSTSSCVHIAEAEKSAPANAPVLINANSKIFEKTIDKAIDKHTGLVAKDSRLVDKNDAIDYLDNSADTAQSIFKTPSPTNDVDPAQTPLLLALNEITFDMINRDSADHAMLKVTKWFENSTNPAREILNLRMSAINDDTKLALEYFLALGEHEGLTENILNEMSFASEAEHDEWEKMLQMTAIESSRERDAMLSVLPSLTNESLVSATLRAVQPQVLPPEERARFLDGVSPYANSENEDVRSAAMIALANFSGHDYSHVIEDALSSGTDQLKSSAIYAASDGGIRTEAIKNQISMIMQDESASSTLRTQAFHGLRSFNLNQQEYNLFYKFYRENILPTEQETSRGQIQPATIANAKC